MKDRPKQTEIPTYTLQPLHAENNWMLTIENNIQLILLHGNLTSIVWHVTQEFHRHDFWEISLVLRGNSTQRFLDKSEPMQTGSVYIIRPHDVHCITPAQSEIPKDMQSSPYVHRDIYIPIEKMKRICAAIDENLYDTLLSKRYPLSASLSVSETNQFESLLNYFAGRDDDFSMMHSVIASHILCTVLENQRYAQIEYPLWLTQLLVNLDREDFMTKSVKEIIDSIGYNQSYVCRQFRKYTGQTLVEYIHKRKCSYSVLLLPGIGIPIAQIAQRLQFSDESTYIRIFKQIYGITPGQWRKKLSNTFSSAEQQK
ncbi:MAG: AraC family transcriptional regulator [Clostridia bacterium]|jgi:AraC family cel operon transcriptional repressor|nr:AraC family transcriptional regulator [Clostridia bacterium]